MTMTSLVVHYFLFPFTGASINDVPTLNEMKFFPIQSVFKAKPHVLRMWRHLWSTLTVLFPRFVTWQARRTSLPRTPMTSGDIAELITGPSVTSNSESLYSPKSKTKINKKIISKWRQKCYYKFGLLMFKI